MDHRENFIQKIRRKSKKYGVVQKKFAVSQKSTA